jgi:hypothetical protein
MSKNWSNAIALYMAVDWRLKCESLSPPYAEFISPKTRGKVRFEIYFTNMFQDHRGNFCVDTETIDTASIGNSDYVILCIWNKQNDNCVVLKTEEAKMMMDNKRECFPLSEIVPKIKRKFAIGVTKTDNADLPDETSR